jgi:hypothetical protein
MTVNISDYARISNDTTNFDCAVFFLHIPKTAGSSVKSIVEHNMSIKEIMDLNSCWNSIMENKGLIRYATKNFINSRFLMGHIPLINIKHFSRNVSIFSFLREPFDLIQSYFYYLQKTGHIPGDMNLSDIIGSPLEKYFTNIQTKWLAGEAENIGDLSTTLTSDTSLSTDHKLLDSALNNMAHFTFVGIVEEFEVSARLLCNIYNWQLPNIIPFENISIEPNNTESKLKDRFKHMIELDLQVYQAAIKALHKDRIYSKAYYIKNELMPNDMIDVCGQGTRLIRSGWYPAEYVCGIGTWRWTGSEFSIYVPDLIPGKYNIRLFVTSHRQPADLLETVIVNGSESISPGIKLSANGYIVNFSSVVINEHIAATGVIQFRMQKPLNIPEDNRTFGLPVKFVFCSLA